MKTGTRARSCRARCMPFALLAWATAGPALAQADAEQSGVAQTEFAQLDPALLAPRSQRAARLEIATTALPRLDALEGGFAGPRVDFTLLPRRRSMGLAVGMSGLFAPATVTGAGLAPASQPTVDVGLHWRHTLDSNQRIDITGWRRMAQQPDAYTLVQASQPIYGARVELNLNLARKSGLVADRGSIGLQLESGGSFTVRRKNGRPMIYYRVRF